MIRALIAGIAGSLFGGWLIIRCGGFKHNDAMTPNDPSSATRPTRAMDCNSDAMAGFAAAHG